MAQPAKRAETAKRVKGATPGTGRRAGLDRADMVAKAIELVEAEGPDALSMRRLATELNVATTTIYWHVGSRDELVTEIIRHQSERLAARPIKGKKPRDRIMSAATHIWESSIEHRAITSLAHQAGSSSLLQYPFEVVLATELEAAGLVGPEAALALQSIRATVTGFLVLALRDESSIPRDRRTTAVWAASEAELDRSTLDALATEPDLNKLFEITLQAVIDNHL